MLERKTPRSPSVGGSTPVVTVDGTSARPRRRASSPHLGTWRLGTWSLAALLLLGGLAISGTSFAAGHQTQVSRQFDLGSDGTVELENLAGEIHLEGGASQVEIEATIHSVGDRQYQLAESLDIEFDQQGDRLTVRAHYPVDRYDEYYYPMLGWGSRTSVRYEGEKVSVRGRQGDAAGLWVDFHLKLPRGVSVKVRNAAGEIVSTQVAGDLDLDAGSGKVTATDGAGRLKADTGSGDIVVRRQNGRLLLDTGSGDIVVEGGQGSLHADTGSGDVELTDFEGTTIEADTGSGDVRLERVRGAVDADTGSGGVTGRELIIIGRLAADTGSGSVDLEGDFLAMTDLDIDTGSGSVRLEGRLPGANLDIDTNSGDIRVEGANLKIRQRDRDSLVGTLDGGGTRFRIDSGSGDVTILGR